MDRQNALRESESGRDELAGGGGVAVGVAALPHPM